MADLRAAIGLAALLLSAAAHAQDPPTPPALAVEQIVERTIAVMDRKPEHLLCRVLSERRVLDGDGKVDDDERSEVEETRHGDHIDWKIVQKWKNGRDVTAQALAEQRRKEDDRKRKGESDRGKDDDDLMEPFSKKWSSHYRFELLKQESIWGRPAYVLRVTAREHKTGAGNGTVWIDAERFVELRGEFVPSKLPDHADWARFQMQFALHPSGVVVPTFLKFEGAGHAWFIKKGFRQTIKWQDCH